MTDDESTRDTVLRYLKEVYSGPDEHLIDDAVASGSDLKFDDLKALDSLTAIEMCMKLEEHYDLLIDIADVAQFDSVDTFAASIAPETDTVDPMRAFEPILVQLREGQSGQTPIFCFHGGDGAVLNYRHLIAELPENIPVFGLQMSGIDGTGEPHKSIDEMIAAYLPAIGTVYPDGLLQFVGYSGGGVVAYEAARQVSALGRDVALVLIDTLQPALYRVSSLGKLAYPQYWYPGNLQKEFVRLRDKVLKRTMRHERNRRRAQFDSGERPVPMEFRSYWLANAYELASAGFDLSPFGGDMLIVRGAKEYDYRYRAAGPALGWDAHVKGDLKQAFLPGDHLSIMRPPLVAELGQHLVSYFAKEK